MRGLRKGKIAEFDSNKIASTDEKLYELGLEPLTKWLIMAAQERRSITYNEVKRRLEEDFHLTSIFTTRIGGLAGAMIDRFLTVDPDIPLLNVLLVRSDTGVPGYGCGQYLAKHFKVPALADKAAPTKDPALWETYCSKAADEVYAYRDWPNSYRRVFNKKLRQKYFDTKGTEKDGIQRGRGTGEGKAHRELRLWVQGNPQEIAPKLTEVRSETEQDLLSGDRPDVIYYAKAKTIGIEVKSRTSDWFDLQRGVYQCVKYRAVLKAQDIRPDADVDVLLITETELDRELKALAKRLEVKHRTVPIERN